MRKFFSLSIAASLASLLFVHVASADTDYQCLKSCMATNQGERTCMGKCTYNLPGEFDSNGKTISAATSAPEGHRVFSTLSPVDQGVSIQKQTSRSPYVTRLDHACMAQCLQTKELYETCSSSCTDVSAAKNGDPLVKAAVPQSSQQAIPLQMNNYNYNLQARPAN